MGEKTRYVYPESVALSKGSARYVRSTISAFSQAAAYPTAKCPAPRITASYFFIKLSFWDKFKKSYRLSKSIYVYYSTYYKFFKYRIPFI
jgi:hypothetical protein